MPGIVTVPLSERVERYERIVAARDAGLTLDRIGALFDPPLTKQRVGAILRAGPPRSQTGGRPAVAELVRRCRACGHSARVTVHPLSVCPRCDRPYGRLELGLDVPTEPPEPVPDNVSRPGGNVSREPRQSR